MTAGEAKALEAEDDLEILLNRGSACSAFFAQLADSTRTPHASEPYREFVKALLLRAEEAKLYTPEAK